MIHERTSTFWWILGAVCERRALNEPNSLQNPKHLSDLQSLAGQMRESRRLEREFRHAKARLLWHRRLLRNWLRARGIRRSAIDAAIASAEDYSPQSGKPTRSGESGHVRADGAENGHNYVDVSSAAATANGHLRHRMEANCAISMDTHRDNQSTPVYRDGGGVLQSRESGIMKTKTKLAIALTLALPFAAFAPDYTISWDPSAIGEPTGYKVYSSTNGLGAPNMNWKLERATAQTSVSLTNVSAAVRSFGISATNATSESAKSTAELVFAPGNVRITQQ